MHSSVQREKYGKEYYKPAEPHLYLAFVHAHGKPPRGFEGKIPDTGVIAAHSHASSW